MSFSLQRPCLLVILVAGLVQSSLPHRVAAQGAAPRRVPGRATSVAASATRTTAFVNVAVLPMDTHQHPVLPGQTVLVRGDQIVAVGPTAQVPVPAGATRVDGQGRFLLPGLGDMAVRLFPVGSLEESAVGPRLFCALANGVTTVRVISPDSTTALARLARRIATGELAGPRLDVVATDTASLTWALQTPTTALYKLQGYVEALLPAGTPIERPAAWYAKPVVAALDSMVTATPPLPLDTTQLSVLIAATVKAGVWNVPLQRQAEQMVQLWTGDTAAVQTSPLLQVRRQLLQGLQAAGAGLLLGTGAPSWGAAYGAAVGQELERLVAAGLTPAQALATSTRNVAAFLGRRDSSGTIAVEKQADLVLLQGNPLTDIRHVARPAGVMVRGRYFSRAQLEAALKPEQCVGW